jgi:hypothetical protein
MADNRILFLVLLLLLTTAVFAQTTYFSTNIYNDWTTISLAAAALSILGSALLIMLSRLFGLRNLEQIGKTEFVYAASTVLIVMMVLGIVELGESYLATQNGIVNSMYASAFGCTNLPTSFTSSQPTLIDWMKLYMQTPTTCVQSFMNVLYAVSVPVEACSSVYMEIFMSEHASGFACKPIAERITNAVQSLSFYLYAFFLIGHVLTFVKYYGGFFFSIGVALRAFPPTRGMGAYMMAISFGLYFVLPFTYILVAATAMPQVQSGLLGGTCDALYSGNILSCTAPAVLDPSDYQCQGASATSAFDVPGQLQSMSSVISNLLTGPNPQVFRLGQTLVTSMCILPIVSFVILMTFVLNTTNLFGGNIPEIGRGLVRLI